MEKYICKNCNKIFNKKHHLISHSNKKNTCINNTTLLTQINTNSLKDDKLIDTNLQCLYCKKQFVNIYSLKRHSERYCKLKINEELLENKDAIKLKENNQVNIDELDIDDKTKIILSLLLNQNKKLMKELKEEMDKIKEENKEIKEENKEMKFKISKINKKTINNNINTQNNQLNTINNNVILAHGKEDLSKIDLETIMKCMSTIKHKEIIPSITKHVYLNDEKPENKNFCVVDMARNKCKYYNGKKWLVGKTTEKIDKIFDSIHNVLTDPFEKERINKTIEFIKANPKKFNEKWIKISNTYLKSLYDEDDKENMENKLKVLEELKLIFFNNKDEITKIKLDDK